MRDRGEQVGHGPGEGQQHGDTVRAGREREAALLELGARGLLLRSHAAKNTKVRKGGSVEVGKWGSGEGGVVC